MTEADRLLLIEELARAMCSGFGDDPDAMIIPGTYAFAWTKRGDRILSSAAEVARAGWQAYVPAAEAMILDGWRKTISVERSVHDLGDIEFVGRPAGPQRQPY